MSDLKETPETEPTAEVVAEPAPETTSEAIDRALEEVEAEEPVVTDGDEVAVADEPVEAVAAEPAKDEAKPEGKDVEAEIADLGIKNAKTADRFRELTGEVKTLRSALEEAGVKDLAQLPQLIESARLGQEIVNDWASLQVTPEQYAGYLAYAQQVNAVASGDLKAAEAAFVTIEREYTALAQLLGKDVAGVDPLAGHADLLEAVEEGDITRKHALELAAVRSKEAVRERVTATQTQQVEQHTAAQRGIDALTAWDQQMFAADPSYAAKRPALNAQVAVIRENLPPDKWVEATKRLYEALPAPVAAQPAKPAPSAVRPGRVTPPLKREFESTKDAIEYALSLDDR